MCGIRAVHGRSLYPPRTKREPSSGRSGNGRSLRHTQPVIPTALISASGSAKPAPETLGTAAITHSPSPTRCECWGQPCMRRAGGPCEGITSLRKVFFWPSAFRIPRLRLGRASSQRGLPRAASLPSTAIRSTTYPVRSCEKIEPPQTAPSNYAMFRVRRRPPSKEEGIPRGVVKCALNFFTPS